MADTIQLRKLFSGYACAHTDKAPLKPGDISLCDGCFDKWKTGSDFALPNDGPGRQTKAARQGS